MSRSRVAPWCWLWLALFAYTGTARCLFGVVAHAFGPTYTIALYSLLCSAASFTFLMEFARTCWNASSRRAIPPSVHLLLVLVAAGFVFGGVNGTHIVLRTCIAVPAALLASVALWRLRAVTEGNTKPLGVSAVSMGIIGICIAFSSHGTLLIGGPGLSIAAAASPLRVALAVARGCSICILMASLWYEYVEQVHLTHQDVGPRPYIRHVVRVVTMMTVVFTLGYIATEGVERSVLRQNSGNLLRDAHAASASITEMDLFLLASPDPREIHIAVTHLADLLSRMCALDSRNASARVFVQIGGQPVQLFSSQDVPGRAQPHVLATITPEFTTALRRALHDGRSTVLRLGSDGRTFVAVTPVETETNHPSDVALTYEVNDTYFGNTIAAQRLWPILITVLVAATVLGVSGAQMRNDEGQLAVAAREARFRGYFELQGVGMAAVAPDGKCRDANPCLAEFLGYSRAQLTTMHICDLVEPGYADEAQRDFANAATHSNSHVSRQVQLLRSDGQIVDAEISASTVCNNEGKLDHVLLVVHDIGERLRREEALRQLSLAVEQSPSSILVTDVDGVILYVNPKFCALTGYTREECVGKTPGVIHSGRTPGEVYEKLWRTIRAGSEWRGILLNRKKSGELMWEDVSISPLTGNDGQITRFVAVKEDITERVAAQNALKESRQRLSLIIQQSPIGVIECDTSAQVRTWNAAAERIFGYTANEAMDRDFLPTLFRQEDRADRQATWDGVLAGAISTTQTVECRTKTGSDVVCRWHFAVIRNGSESPVGVVSLVEDVTESTLIDKALHESEERFRAMATASLDAIIMMDENRRISFWNPAAESIFGYTPEQAVGRDLHQLLVSPNLAQAASNKLDAEERSNWSRSKPITIETTGRRADGSGFPAEVQVSYVQVHGHWAALGTVRDITFRKKAEQEILQARDEAEAANRAKSDFLASMSHEIRTPMNGIMGMTELLLETELDPEQHDYARTIRSSGEALLSIINDILDFSKIEAGRMTIDDADLDLSNILEGAIELVAASRRDPAVEYVCDISPEILPVLHGDPGRIRQIVVNLLGNAAKFTEHGEIVLRAEVTDQTDTVQNVRITVSDTGIGIPAGKQALIFDSFTQVDPSATRRHGGTGLGLAICRRLANLMGGTIEVQSEPGVGSTFTVSLPLQRPAHSSHSPKCDVPELAGVGVLIVDDSPASRRAIQNLLTASGATSFEASSMTGALNLIGKVPPRNHRCVVLLDEGLPQADPSIVHEAAVAAGQDVPVIGLTVASGACRDGYAGIVNRPVRRECLLRALHAVFARNRQTDAETHTKAIEPSVSSIAGTRVLVAEDNAVNQKVAVRVLQRSGCIVETVDNGADAARIACTGNFDIVLMDCHMPDVDGYESTRRIRAHEALTGGHIPVIALTASAMSTDRDRCLDAGMDAFVSKPFRAVELDEVIRQYCTGSPAKPNTQPAEKVDQLGPFDEKQLNGSCLGDSGFAKEIVDEYAHTLSVRAPILRKAMEDGDVESACMCAHALKGASLTVGASALAELFRQMETHVRDADIVGATALLNQMRTEWERFHEAFTGFQAKHAA